MTTLYLAKKYLKVWKANQNWDLKAFQKRVNRELGCEVKYAQCYIAKKIATKMIFWDANEEYGRAWNYTKVIRRPTPVKMEK